MKRMTSIGVIIVAVVVVLAGCSSGGSGGNDAASPDTDKLITIHVGETAGVPSAFLNYGVQEGYFEKEGLDVVVDTGQGGAAAIPSVIGGSSQFAGSNTVSVILAKSEGLPLQMIAPGTFAADSKDDAWSALLVPKDSKIKGPEDLAGKTIAVSTLQNIGDVTIKSSLEQMGIDISGIKFVEIGFPDMLAALANGNVDVVWEIEPFYAQALAAGDRAVLYPYQAQPGLMIGSFVASDSYIAKNPKIVKAFQNGIEATVNEVNDDPDSFRAALVKLAKIPEALTKAIHLPTWKTSIDVKSLQFVEEHMEKYGIITNPVDVSKLVAK